MLLKPRIRSVLTHNHLDHTFYTSVDDLLSKVFKTSFIILDLQNTKELNRFAGFSQVNGFCDHTNKVLIEKAKSYRITVYSQDSFFKELSCLLDRQ